MSGSTDHPVGRRRAVPGLGARLVVLVAVLVVTAGPVGLAAAAPPPPPAAYYGSLAVNGEPAPVGVTVTAHVDGERRGQLVTASEGAYGGPGAFDEKLQVNGTDEDEGKAVTFSVGGVRADVTVAWEPGDVRRVDLAVSGDVELPGEGADDGQSGAGSGGGGGGTGDAGGAPPANETETAPPDNATVTGGPGAAVTVERTANRTSVTVTNATANGSVSVELGGDGNDSDLALDGLDISTTAGGDFTLNVTQSDEPPAESPAFEETPTGAVGYLQIDHSVPDDRIESVVFRFRVSRTRLADRGLDPADVVLYRYHDGEWTALETVPVEVGAGQVAFRAVSPGLSVFAIGGRPAAATTTAATADTTATEGTAATTTSRSTPASGNDDGQLGVTPTAGATSSPGLLARPVVRFGVAVLAAAVAVLLGLAVLRRR